MEEAIETDKFYLSNPFFVPEYPSNELKVLSEEHLDEIKTENTIAFKTEPDIDSNGTETSIIADPVAKGTDFIFSQSSMDHRQNFKVSNVTNAIEYLSTRAVSQYIRLVFEVMLQTIQILKTINFH